MMPDGPQPGHHPPLLADQRRHRRHQRPLVLRAQADGWAHLRQEMYRMESQYLAAEQEKIGNASAVCFMAADLQSLLQ